MRVMIAGMIERMDEFVPLRSLRGGHRMTLYGWGNPRYFPTLPRPVTRYFDPAPRTRVVSQCHWHADPCHRSDLRH